jgi:hypothetical protein
MEWQPLLETQPPHICYLKQFKFQKACWISLECDRRTWYPEKRNPSCLFVLSGESLRPKLAAAKDHGLGHLAIQVEAPGRSKTIC